LLAVEETRRLDSMIWMMRVLAIFMVCMLQLTWHGSEVQHRASSKIEDLNFLLNRSCYPILMVAGYLRVFEFVKELLVCGSKSYFGALLCCAWRYPTIPTRSMSQ
jgi:hypothetical protein